MDAAINWQSIKLIRPAVSTWPGDRNFHLFSSPAGEHLFAVDGSRLYDIDAATRAEIEAAIDSGDNIDALLGLPAALPRRRIDPNPPLRALSLTVAQTCNLGCDYCYAEGGGFGEDETQMSWQVAHDAIVQLIDGLDAGDRANIAFMGGEPLVNRQLVHRAATFAAEYAQRKKVALSFSITTNGTLLREEDIALFDRFGFSVSISIDGVGNAHDNLRPFRNGRPSFERIIQHCQTLLDTPRQYKVSARVTVTPANMDLLDTLNYLVGLGFDNVGFAPLLRSPTGKRELGSDDLDRFLANLKLCSDEFEQQLAAGVRYPFSNALNALKEINLGAQKTHPCGAGVGYAGVSASGGLYACHRFVEDSAAELGDVQSGLDPRRQQSWISAREVDRQQPCQSCWARYLCGGGCHHETIDRPRTSCHFVRGWLEHCLAMYLRLQTNHPEALARALNAG